MKRALIIFLSLFAALDVSAAPFAASDAQAPAVLEADALRYDNKNGIVVGKGNVEIVQDGRILFADELIYDQKNNKVYARGNVSLMEPTGDVFFAEQVELNDDLKQGVIRDFKARFKDDSLLAANKLNRRSENVMEMVKAVYSPCKICEDQASPLWQLKANRVALNDNEKRMYYEDAFMELYGVPVLYTPYFSHPSPGAKRKSGFLVPTYSSNSNLGATVKIPYYWNIAPDMDATLAPIMTSDEGPVMTAEFRHLLPYGSYELAGSITNPEEQNVTSTGGPQGGRELRGHIRGEGFFHISDHWVGGFDVKRASDDTYLTRYRFGNEDLLTSTAFTERFEEHDYVGIRGITFQGLAPGDDPDTTPLVLPFINAHFEHQLSKPEEKLALDMNTMMLHRTDGAKSRRLSVKGGYENSFTTQGGHVFDVGASVRGDVYHVEDVMISQTTTEDDSVTGRVVPQLEAGWEYPVAKSFGESGTLVLSPVVRTVISPYGGNPDEIPNEDSQQFELTDLNIFRAHKFTGLDRIESGPRVNYGMRGGLYGNAYGDVEFSIGQHYRLKDDSSFGVRSGMDDNLSDVVGRVGYSLNGRHQVDYRFQLDRDDGSIRRNEVSAMLDFSPVSFLVDYVYLEDAPAAGAFSSVVQDREEIFAHTALELTDYWSTRAHVRRNLSETNGGLISAGGALSYQDECLGLDMLFGREFTRDRDIEPSTYFTVQIRFKNIN